MTLHSPIRFRCAALIATVSPLLLLFIAISAPASTGGPSAASRTGTAELNEAEIAAMSDEEIRRVLIDQARRKASLQAAHPPRETERGIVGLITAAKDGIRFLNARMAALKTERLSAREGEASGLFAYLTSGEKGGDPVRAIWTTLAVFLAGLVIEWGFRRAVRPAMDHLKRMTPVRPLDRPLGLASLAALEILSLSVFVAATLLLSFAFLDGATPQRVLIATYLTAIVIARLSVAALNAILAPKTENLRLVPLSSEAATYLHRGLLAFFTLGGFGLLTCGLFRIAGSDKAIHFWTVSLISGFMASILAFMVLHRRKAVARTLAGEAPQGSLRAKLSAQWHVLALLLILISLAVSILERLLFDDPGFSGIKIVLLIGLYLAIDGLLRRALAGAFFLARRPPEDFRTVIRSLANGESGAETPDGKGHPSAEPEGESAPAISASVPVNRLHQGISTGLRVALAAYMLFWLFRIWGVRIPVGEEIADAVFDVLVALLVCYVGWELISAAIQRRIDVEMPEANQEAEEGGAGGSRIGTLLLLLRKFMAIVLATLLTMILLSRMGVDIGPLIAGAGVVGLAIGFGAQTLVRDIISGLFFLIDDAFRVGDYVDVGAASGTVEQISIRSFKLRHPRGMLSTIPFGDIGQVMNYSRDYIITKLDFRVPYDTDVEKVRKIVKKKVYQPILADEALAPKLLDKIKSQGVRQMEDSAMIMRVKYKTIPGEQFVVRREVYRRIQEAFREAGIEFAHRKVTVQLPAESGDGGMNRDAMAQRAGAAAALAGEEGGATGRERRGE